MVQNAMVKLDFRATATHFVNIFVFLLIFDFFYGFGGVQWAVNQVPVPKETVTSGLFQAAGENNVDLERTTLPTTLPKGFLFWGPGVFFVILGPKRVFI